MQSGSPAAKAGLAKGDVVTAVDGHSVADAAVLDRRRRRTRARGDHVTLSYTRNGSAHTLSVTLGTRPSSS